jgi:16S rRNA (uracil1498-N3)-methyltransferase
MRHRFFVANIEDAALAGDELHHATRVVRVREGEEIEIFDGRGAIAIACAGANGTLQLVGRVDPRESPLAVDLAMSIIQLEKFELVLQKATELGVRSIIPLVSQRVEVRPERYKGKAERWEKIVFEATKQCGRGVIPKIETPIDFEAAMSRENKIVFEADADAEPAIERPGQATLFIGPEGGFTEEEIALAREKGASIQRLGPRRLRAETAAIAACAIAAARWGDI